MTLDRERDPLSLMAHPAHLRSRHNPQPFLQKDHGEGRGDFRLVARENRASARDEGHLGAKASKHLAQFEGDVAAAQDEQRVGLLAQLSPPRDRRSYSADHWSDRIRWPGPAGWG